MARLTDQNPMTRLTDLKVKALPPDPSRRLEMPDPGQAGLYLIIQPTGRKSWAVRYRQNGRSRKLTLGRFPAIGLADARRMAAKALDKIERGEDPATDMKARRTVTGAAGHQRTDTLAALVAEYLQRRPREKALRSIGEVKRIFDKYVLPVIGQRPAAKITKREIIELLDGIADRPAPIMANRTFEALRALFNWSIGRDWMAASPMAGMNKPFEPQSRDRVLSVDEIRWFWKATGAMGYPFGDALRVCLLTGQRVGEVSGLTRSEIGQEQITQVTEADGERIEITAPGNVWTIPAARAKNGEEHKVPLADPALAIIKNAPAIGPNGLVFTTTGLSPISGRSKAKVRLDRLMAAAAEEERGEKVEIDRFTIHDLRRTCASQMAELRVAPHVIEAVLNHRTGVVRGIARVYNRYDYGIEKREALDAWAHRLNDLVTGKPAEMAIEVEAKRDRC